MKEYVHKKTGKIYTVINEYVSDATNGQNFKMMVLYETSDGIVYVMERNEFIDKFAKLRNIVRIRKS